MMKDLFPVILDQIRSGHPLILAKVIESTGSTPRGAGACMLVGTQGRIFGTIGGGAIEHEAERLSLKYLEEKRNDIRSFQLTQDEIQGLGMVCGGKVTVYFQYLASPDKEFSAFAEDIIAKIKTGTACWLITHTARGEMSVYSPGNGFSGRISPPPADLLPFMASKPAQRSLNGLDYFIEPLLSPGVLYVFGGGHVAQELVPTATAVGFRCVVIDDRPEFTQKELFPTAEKTMLVNFERLVLASESERKTCVAEDSLVITAHDYITIMTRGHQHDTLIQAKALKTAARYIGVMGSRHKKAYVEAKLREAGFTASQLSRVKTPVGLDIGAQTPAEIAVSIAAELISVRAKSDSL